MKGGRVEGREKARVEGCGRGWMRSSGGRLYHGMYPPCVHIEGFDQIQGLFGLVQIRIHVLDTLGHSRIDIT